MRINLIYNPGRLKFGLFIWTLHFQGIFYWNDSCNSPSGPICQKQWVQLLWIFSHMHVMRILLNYNPGRCLGFSFDYSVYEAFWKDATFKKPSLANFSKTVYTLILMLFVNDLHIMGIILSYNPGKHLGFWYGYRGFEAFWTVNSFKIALLDQFLKNLWSYMITMIFFC